MFSFIYLFIVFSYSVSIQDDGLSSVQQHDATDNETRAETTRRRSRLLDKVEHKAEVDIWTTSSDSLCR